ncbi:MAG TPA: SprT family zinc-dependent metalloprotease [Dehalococcoidia bacterium]|nr:SprT family zinc-dependent metalloprotease [Dehalococcoidia bacterium]
MSERGEVRYGSSTIGYTVNRSHRRRKTVEITLDGQSGVLVAAPQTLPAEDIAQLVRRRAPWILRRATSAMLQTYSRQFISGESVLYLGRRVRMTIEEAQVSRPMVQFRHWSFQVRVPSFPRGECRGEAVKRVLLAWYKRKALERLKARTLHWSRALGRRPTNVLVRDQRQRWASCSPDGTLRFNWRIIMADPSLIDYVVVHELAHLLVRHHSADFWSLLASVMPDFAERRRRLRELGPHLSL